MTVAQPLWALVPLRGGAGKQRLSTLLNADQRRNLVFAMAQDVLRALADVPEIAGIAVTTSDAELAAMAESFGAVIISDEGCEGLNAALHHAAGVLQREMGAGSLLVMHGDLPLASRDAIQSLIAGHEGGVTVARAARDGGSNALLLSPPDVITFHFGADSCAAHLEAARLAGFSTARALAIPGLSDDIDEEQDLRAFACSDAVGATMDLLRKHGLLAQNAAT